MLFSRRYLVAISVTPAQRAKFSPRGGFENPNKYFILFCIITFFFVATKSGFTLVRSRRPPIVRKETFYSALWHPFVPFNCINIEKYQTQTLRECREILCRSESLSAASRSSVECNARICSFFTFGDFCMRAKEPSQF